MIAIPQTKQEVFFEKKEHQRRWRRKGGALAGYIWRLGASRIDLRDRSKLEF